MGSLARKAIGGSIHKIREFELEKVSLAEEFDILQIVGEGWFGKILLVEHKATDTEMVLKALPKPYTALRDFYREFHYGLHLGAHRNVITTYDVAFETAGFYVFSQEYAPLGDLTSNVSETGIGELHTKRVARQLAAALEHLHGRDLVHRDVKLDNILVFKSDFSRVKLCDFGETRRSGSVVRRHNEWLPYAPPEVLTTANDDMYKAVTSHDVWQFAIVIFVCLTGCLPWQKAASDDPRYTRFVSWHSSSIPIRRVPKLFKLVSSKAQRLFRKILEPNIDKRPATLSDVQRFLDDRWLAKNSADKNNGLTTEDDGLCPSMYSFHSSPEEKNKLLHSLTQYGIETTVDRGAKKDRIRAWIESSVIEEEEELEEEEDSEDEERVGIMDNETGPVGERMNRGPIEDKRQQVVKDSARIEKQKRRERRLSSISRRTSSVYTPPIDPRIPLENQRFSKSEMNLNRNFIFPSEDHVDSMDIHVQDDATVTYSERRAESQPDIKTGDLKHVLPFQNLATINGKDTSPPKQNGNSYSTTSLPQQQNLPNESQYFSGRQITTSMQQNAAPQQNSPKGSQTIQQSSPKGSQTIHQNSPKGSQTIHQNSTKGSQTIQQNSPKGSQTIHQSSPKGSQTIHQNSPKGSQTIHQNSPKGSQTFQQNSPQLSQTIAPMKPNTQNKQTETPQQNLPNQIKQSSFTQTSKQNGVHHNGPQQQMTNNLPKIQPKQQVPIRSNLVENRDKYPGHAKYNNMKAPSFRKKPMKERFEAYGSFEEKSNTSSSTGRSISK